MNNLWKGSLIFCFSLLLSQSAFAQLGKLTRGIRAAGRTTSRISRSVSAGSALGRMDRIAAEAEATVRRMGDIKITAPTVRETSAILRRNHFLNGSLSRTITPTPVEKLYPNIISPSQEQVQQFRSEYTEAMKDFQRIRHELTPKLLYKNLPGEGTPLSLADRRYFTTELSGLELTVDHLRTVVFSHDVPLQQVQTWLQTVLPEVNPFYVPNSALKVAVRPDNRVVDKAEFFLKEPKDPAYSGSTIEVPENWHVAVLNDDLDILYMYQVWEREGRMGKGWHFSLYKDTNDLIRAFKGGASFDLVITDMVVPGGGGKYLTSWLRQEGKNMPVIGCSNFPAYKLNDEELFQLGFDGYMYADDMFEEVYGSFNWMSNIKRYFYYKNLHGWQR